MTSRASSASGQGEDLSPRADNICEEGTSTAEWEVYTVPTAMAAETSNNVFSNGRTGPSLREWTLKVNNKFETRKRQFPTYSSYDAVMDLADSVTGEAVKEWETFCIKMREDDVRDVTREVLREKWITYRCALHKQRMGSTPVVMPERPEQPEPNLIEEFCAVLRKRFPANNALNLQGLANFRRRANETAAELYYRLVTLAEDCPSFDQLRLQSMYLRQLPDNIQQQVTDYWVSERNKAKAEGTPVLTLDDIQRVATNYEIIQEERYALDPGAKADSRSEGRGNVPHTSGKYKSIDRGSMPHGNERGASSASSNKFRQNITCFICGGQGHGRRECPSRLQGSSAGPPEQTQGDNTQSVSSRSERSYKSAPTKFDPVHQTLGAECSACGKPNHTAEQCWTANPHKDPRGKRPDQRRAVQSQSRKANHIAIPQTEMTGQATHQPATTQSAPTQHMQRANSQPLVTHQVNMSAPLEYLDYGQTGTNCNTALSTIAGAQVQNVTDASTIVPPVKRSARLAQKRQAQGPDHGRRVTEPLRYPLSFQPQPRYVTPGTMDLNVPPAAVSLPGARKRSDNVTSNPISELTSTLADLVSKFELIVQRLNATAGSSSVLPSPTEDELEVLQDPQLQLAIAALKDVPAVQGDARAIRRPNSAVIDNEHGAFMLEGLAPQTVMLDTGAQISMITMKVVKALNLAEDAIERKKIIISTANGQRESVYGRTRIPLTCCINSGTATSKVKSAYFLITEATTYDVLLGNDFLWDVGSCVDLHTEVWTYRCECGDGRVSIGTVPLNLWPIQKRMDNANSFVPLHCCMVQAVPPDQPADVIMTPNDTIPAEQVEALAAAPAPTQAKDDSSDSDDQEQPRGASKLPHQVRQLSLNPKGKQRATPTTSGFLYPQQQQPVFYQGGPSQLYAEPQLAPGLMLPSVTPGSKRTRASQFQPGRAGPQAPRQYAYADQFPGNYQPAWATSQYHPGAPSSYSAPNPWLVAAAQPSDILEGSDPWMEKFNPTAARESHADVMRGRLARRHAMIHIQQLHHRLLCQTLQIARQSVTPLDTTKAVFPLVPLAAGPDEPAHISLCNPVLGLPEAGFCSTKGLVVLDLCSGISTGLYALLDAGIPVKEYYMNEIDMTCHVVAKRMQAYCAARYRHAGRNMCQSVNLFPDDVVAIPDFLADNIPISPDLIICGWPCTGFSRAGKLRGLRDKKSCILWDVLEVIKIFQDNAPEDINGNKLMPGFLIENVSQCSSPDPKKQAALENDWALIREYLGPEVVLDAAKLGGASHRVRAFWTNLMPTSFLQDIYDHMDPIPPKPLREILTFGFVPQPAFTTDSTSARRLEKGYFPINVQRQPLKVFPTLVATPDSDAYKFDERGVPAQGMVHNNTGLQNARPLNATERARILGLPEDITDDIVDPYYIQMTGNSFDVHTVRWIFQHIHAFCRLHYDL